MILDCSVVPLAPSTEDNLNCDEERCQAEAVCSCIREVFVAKVLCIAKEASCTGKVAEDKVGARNEGMGFQRLSCWILVILPGLVKQFKPSGSSSKSAGKPSECAKPEDSESQERMDFVFQMMLEVNGLEKPVDCRQSDKCAKEGVNHLVDKPVWLEVAFCGQHEPTKEGPTAPHPHSMLEPEVSRNLGIESLAHELIASLERHREESVLLMHVELT